MASGQSIRRGIAWLFVGNTSKQLLGFVFGVVLARLLVPEDFGMLITIQVFTGLAGFIAGGGMGQALIRAKTATTQDYDIVFTLQLIIGCLIYAAFFLAAPWFARWYDHPLYSDLLRVSALSFILRPFVNLPSNMLHRAMRFKAQAVVSVITLILSSTVSIGLAYLGHGVWSLIWGGIVGSVASALLLMPIARWRPRLSTAFGRGREIARYGVLFSINDIVFYLRSQLSAFILSRTLGPASVGLFNKGESLARMPHIFITGSVYPVLFRALGAEQDNLDRSRYLYFRSIALVALYATPFYVGLLWLAEPLVRGVYGVRWVEAAGPLAILALAWPFWLMGNLSGNVLKARNWLGRELAVQVSSLAIGSLAIWVGLAYGIDGVAWAVVGTAAFTGICQYGLATRCLDARLSGFPRALVPAGVLNVLLATVLFLMDLALPPAVRQNDLVYVLAMGTAGGLVYGLAFLYVPFAALAVEQQRWRTKLRLTRANPG
ncbi:MAG: lipopolysaccharide biosynthesis protein [Gammaproteobacteria bacterium]